MAIVIVDESSLEDIADAIRSKNGSSDTYKPAEMADAILAISGGGVTPTGTKEISITQNGTTTEDVTNYASAQIAVNVPNSYSASDEGKVVDNGALVAQTSKSIGANGTYDTTTNNEVVVSVPNSYSASDEGKVVSNGALVSQTSDTVTTNDTYDTTLINSLTVNVSGGNAEHYTGTIVFSDENATSITIPVAIGSTDEFLFEFELIKTGTVADGVVTYDVGLKRADELGTSARLMCGAWGKRRSTTIIKVSGNKPLFGSWGHVQYSYATNGTYMLSEGATTALSLDANSFTFTPSTATNFCFEGYHYEYSYHVLVARGAL